MLNRLMPGWVQNLVIHNIVIRNIVIRILLVQNLVIQNLVNFIKSRKSYLVLQNIVIQNFAIQNFVLQRTVEYYGEKKIERLISRRRIKKAKKLWQTISSEVSAERDIWKKQKNVALDCLYHSISRKRLIEPT